MYQLDRISPFDRLPGRERARDHGDALVEVLIGEFDWQEPKLQSRMVHASLGLMVRMLATCDRLISVHLTLELVQS